MAQYNFLHLIHCLDTLRKASHYEYYHRQTYGPEGPTNRYWGHLDHCTFMLLDNLMCNADMSLITYTWVDTQTNPFPDFEAMHQCRNFDRILDHAKKVQIREEFVPVKPKEFPFGPAPEMYPGQLLWAGERAKGEFSTLRD